jgi:hypothetical protein
VLTLGALTDYFMHSAAEASVEMDNQTAPSWQILREVYVSLFDECGVTSVQLHDALCEYRIREALPQDRYAIIIEKYGIVVGWQILGPYPPESRPYVNQQDPSLGYNKYSRYLIPL